MSLADQFRNLNKQAAAMRQNLFGVNSEGKKQQAKYDGGAPIGCYYSPVRTQEQLDAAGFRSLHDTIVRIAKADLLSVKIGKQIKLLDTPQGDLIVVVDEFGNSGVNPEWVLGCKNLF